jgi:hypothetical protein
LKTQEAGKVLVGSVHTDRNIVGNRHVDGQIGRQRDRKAGDTWKTDRESSETTFKDINQILNSRIQELLTRNCMDDRDLEVQG